MILYQVPFPPLYSCVLWGNQGKRGYLTSMCEQGQFQDGKASGMGRTVFSDGYHIPSYFFRMLCVDVERAVDLPIWEGGGRVCLWGCVCEIRC